ncbi:MAG: serine hydrolase, partial [Bacteroidota bacterium]
MKNFLLIFAIICILSACKKDVEQLNTKECQISNVGLNNHIQATELQHLLDKSVAIGIPGITAVVHSESDGFFYGTSGYSDLSRMSVLKACNTFRVASLTKTFMGVAFMQLVESNQIDVNTNISTILDKNILEGLEKANETTIGELLSHTSGIANYDDNTRFVATVLNEPGKELSVDDRLDFAKQLRGTPDWVIEKYEQVYSNTNYVLLELILEEVSGKSYEEYITENI